MKTKLLLKMILLIFVLSLIALILYAISYWNIIPKKYYQAQDFGIKTVISSIDKNENGVDDYTDILLGARQDAKNHPTYHSAYYAGGYPPENEGVCTDLVWRALKNAGYTLKDMIDKDIAEHVKDYPRTEGKPDPNIDFRRVGNLKVFFEKHCLNLTTDTTQIHEWQPGDIVTFGLEHIAIISDKRNQDGIPWIIHNGGQPVREEDALLHCGTISGHFRFQLNEIDR
ncbi:MAG: DUF1287 domain-containing protein [Clostridia bacterium]